jgi:hypothetical protein
LPGARAGGVPLSCGTMNFVSPLPMTPRRSELPSPAIHGRFRASSAVPAGAGSQRPGLHSPPGARRCAVVSRSTQASREGLGA